MLSEIGVEKLTKYCVYKKEIDIFNRYKDDVLKEFGSTTNLPINVQYYLERTRARLERYAAENCIKEISDEILNAVTSH